MVTRYKISTIKENLFVFRKEIQFGFPPLFLKMIIFLIVSAHAALGTSFFCRCKRRMQEKHLRVGLVSATLPKRRPCSNIAYRGGGDGAGKYQKVAPCRPHFVFYRTLYTPPPEKEFFVR